MRKTSKSLLFGFVLALIVHPSIHAQTTIGAPTAANTTPAGQAPDEVMKKLSDLVHAGKYAEAQQTVAALLILYPDDQRLVKAKVLLDKASVTAGAPSVAPTSNPPSSNLASPQPSSSLAGMDKVDYNALIELARQAQQTTDLEQQKASLKQFMDQSSLFLQKHPNQMLLWQLRAASAISLNDPLAGYEAGQKLLAMGAADSNDSNGQRMLAQLKNKGWLDTEPAVKQAEHLQKSEWILGTWTLQYCGYVAKGQKCEGNEIVEFSRSSDSAVDGYNLKKDGSKRESPSVRVTFPDSGEIGWEYLDAAGITVVSEIDSDHRSVKIFLSSQYKGKTYTTSEIFTRK